MAPRPMSVAIAFITGRSEPHLEWVVDAIEQQAIPGDEVTLIVIDALAAWDPARGAHAIGFRETSAIVDLIESEPKPNPWQGKHRLIGVEGWAMSNARNTALVLCPPDIEYISFLDDRARPGPSWLDAIRRGFHKRDSVRAGAYEKTEDRAEGAITVRDHRLAGGARNNCGGGWLFGCAFALPLAWALEVNGFEEGCDGLSMEDVIFGLMLANRGRRIDYVPDLFVSQDRTGGQPSLKGTGPNTYAATDKGVSPNDKSHAALARFGKRTRTEFTPDLSQLRVEYHGGRISWPLPDPNLRDWYDGQPIREMFR